MEATYIYNIGDCISFNNKNNEYYVIILHSISKTQKSITYNFVQLADSFSQKPDIKAILASKFVGQDVLHYSNDNTRSYEKGYKLIHIEHSDLLEMTANLLKIGNVPINNKLLNVSEGGYSTSLFSLLQSIEIAKKANIGCQKYPLSLILDTNHPSSNNDIIETWELAQESAHPVAQKLLPHDFFWDVCHFHAPFGNDDGWDVLHIFKNWRQEHPSTPSDKFITSYLAKRWQFPIFHLKMTAIDNIPDFISSYSMQRIDYAVICACFAQIVLEGKVDYHLKSLAIKAIKRQLDERILKQFSKDQSERKEILETELTILSNI